MLLVETAAKWEATASKPRVSVTHCLALIELLSVSLVVNVFETITKSVSSILISSIRSLSFIPSILETL